MSQSNQPDCFNPELLIPSLSISSLHNLLRNKGCNGCFLGLQEGLKAPVVYRGNPEAKLLLIGEAPGLEENLNGAPFVGPAGKLLDRMFKTIGLDTETDCLVTNIVFCRPLAPKGSGRQNQTPTKECKDACNPYIDHVIKTNKPELIVLIGKEPALTLLPEFVKSATKATEVAGKLYFANKYPSIPFFIILHPAYLLHAQGSEREAPIKARMKKDLEVLKGLLDEVLI